MATLRAFVEALTIALKVLAEILDECKPLIRAKVRSLQANEISGEYNAYRQAMAKALESQDAVAVAAVFARFDDELLSRGIGPDSRGGPRRGDGAQPGRDVHGVASVAGPTLADGGSAAGSVGPLRGSAAVIADSMGPAL